MRIDKLSSQVVVYCSNCNPSRRLWVEYSLPEELVRGEESFMMEVRRKEQDNTDEPWRWDYFYDTWDDAFLIS